MNLTKYYFMKNLILAVVLVAAISFTSEAQITTPQPSPAGSVSSTVGLTDVTIDYSRPKVKGRKIFGEGGDFLQPYGQTWRSGANQGSVISFSTDVEVAGTKVEAGEYLIFTVPGKDEWQFMLYSDLGLGGNVAGYDNSKEVLRTSVKSMTASPQVETLTFNISDISEDNTSAAIELAWADVSIKVPMKVDFDAQVMEEIAQKTQVNPGNYMQAANYYLASGKDLNQALEWVDMYLAVGENSKQFWNVHTKARILAAMGNKKDAIATAEMSLAAAKANAAGDFGYIKRNEDLISSLK